MLRKNWRVTPTMAAHSIAIPTFAAMNGQMMYSPEPTPMPARITLGPRTLPRDNGSGMSLNGIAVRFLVGAPS
jgi:hypothetical protein